MAALAARVIRGVNARAQTPAWMKTRLERAGQRSVSALVDISNYVMLELGRPSHVFDLDKIHGDLSVRWAREGETLELLNGQTVTLDSKVGVVVAGDQVESLAGIMGARPRRSPSTRRTSIWKPRSGGRSRWPAARAATSSAPRPATAASAAWTSPRFRSTSNSSRA